VSKPIRFAIIGGGGFRAQYYLRIAQALPELFHISGLVVRSEEQGQILEQQWKVTTYRTLEQLLDKEQLDFVVVATNKSASLDYLLALADRGIPILAETPPAPDLKGLLLLHEQLTCKAVRVQVAEQYHFQPMQAARLAVIASGRLGNITQTTVSISQMYHGVNLIRKFLGVGFEETKIKGMRFKSAMIAGPDRSGLPREEKTIMSERDIAWMDFGGKLGIYDYTKDQHRSWIRSNHVSVRGEGGELFDHRLSVLEDFATPLSLELKRINAGEEENLEGYFLKGIMAGERWVYKNPFVPARLYDDEIAIATCLQKMANYVAGGPIFYSLADASQDHYLGMMMEEAIQSGETITTTLQPWADYFILNPKL